MENGNSCVLSHNVQEVFILGISPHDVLSFLKCIKILEYFTVAVKVLILNVTPF